ncbi:MAG: hypothetical protein ACTSYD_13090 [Candidatus Heimdallarchaeaceae archaeon]
MSKNSLSKVDAVLQQIIALIKKSGKLNEIAENELLAYFGKRGENAIRALKEKRLVKLVITSKIALWEVSGKQEESYLIIDNDFCECKDFQIRVIGRGERHYCYHILTKIIGEKTGLYTTKELSPQEYAQMIEKRFERLQE